MVKRESKKGEDGAWNRFEKAVDVALKTPAKHKPTSRKKPRKRAKT